MCTTLVRINYYLKKYTGMFDFDEAIGSHEILAITMFNVVSVLAIKVI